MRQMRQHLTYSNVIATLCLFLLLGGGTAVALQGSNTVFSDDIVNGQVKSADVQDGGLSPTDIRNVVIHAVGGPATFPPGGSKGNPTSGTIPLTHNVWSQGAQEIAWPFAWAKSEPDGCTSGGTGLRVRAYNADTGALIDTVVDSGISPEAHDNGGVSDLGLTDYVLPSGVKRRVELRASWENHCPVQVKLNSLKVYVLAFR
jgi:hypothetical protein